jgi:hypothetical protein
MCSETPDKTTLHVSADARRRSFVPSGTSSRAARESGSRTAQVFAVKFCVSERQRHGGARMPESEPGPVEVSAGVEDGSQLSLKTMVGTSRRAALGR